MKNIELEKVYENTENAFKVKELECKYFTSPLHFHPEYELVFIGKGDGCCFAGDGIVQFKKGDLFFFDSNIPHYFLSSDEYYKDDSILYSISNFIQFKKNILPENYLNMPGMKNIKHLIDNGQRGLVWDISNNNRLIKDIINLKALKGFHCLMSLYSILNEVGLKVKDGKPISSVNIKCIKMSNDSAYQKILEYVSLHFQKKISLKEISDYVCMDKCALCRYFKLKTGDSIFNYISQFRISYVKNQLINTDKFISEIAYNAGFNNIVNFNIQFKRFTGYSPTLYRKMFK